MALTSQQKFKTKVVIFIISLLGVFVWLSMGIVNQDRHRAKQLTLQTEQSTVTIPKEDFVQLETEEALARHLLDQKNKQLDEAKTAKASSLMLIQYLTENQEIKHKTGTHLADFAKFYKLDPYAKAIVTVKLSEFKWSEDHSLVCIAKDKEWKKYRCYPPNVVHFQ